MVGVLIRSEAFDKASGLLEKLRSGEQWGWPEAQYACLMAYRGKDRLAAQYVEMSKKRLAARGGRIRTT